MSMRNSAAPISPLIPALFFFLAASYVR